MGPGGGVEIVVEIPDADLRVISDDGPMRPGCHELCSVAGGGHVLRPHADESHQEGDGHHDCESSACGSSHGESSNPPIPAKPLASGEGIPDPRNAHI